jgi:hypothetical protein
VMPLKDIDVFYYWKGLFGKHNKASIRNAIPLCIICTIWRERNNRIFIGVDGTMQLRSFFF